MCTFCFVSVLLFWFVFFFFVCLCVCLSVCLLAFPTGKKHDAARNGPH